MVQMYSKTDIHTLKMDTTTVCKQGLHKKVKKNKQKTVYFVLHTESPSTPARLEYYKSKSQYEKGKKPERTVFLKLCFSINAFSDSRVKFGLTIFTRDDSFHISFESEEMRDSWLMATRSLMVSNSEQIRAMFEHVWNVRVTSRNMRPMVEGHFRLCLTQRQATLVNSVHPDHHIQYPLEVVRLVSHSGAFFRMEVGRLAETGPGELWMELEDSLIAQNVHHAFLKNMSARSPEEASFRQPSRSLSYQDKHAWSTRLRSVSDARQRGRPATSLLTSPSVCSLGHRERSDSIDSHGTSTSMSTEDGECCRNPGHCSRAGTPDPRPASPYVSMSLTNATAPSTSASSLADMEAENSYADMSGSDHSRSDKNSNFVYIDMVGQHQSFTDMSSRDSGYIDMTCGQCSPNRKAKSRPDKGRSYLIDDTPSSPHPRHYSVGARPQMQKLGNTEYVEMTRRDNLTEKDKSVSAPHLQPLTVAVNSECKCRDHHTDRISTSHRPRGSSWSHRTRSAPTSHSHRTRSFKTKNTTQETAAYIDMSRGSQPPSSTYVDMSPGSCLSPKTSAEDKENYLPCSRSSSRSHILSEPFPELCTSSDDDLSIHSMEGSLRSDTDSVSSHSHYSGTLDSDPYVAVQSVRCSAPNSKHSRVLMKPAKVASFIKDEPSQRSDDYIEMAPQKK